jgi:hypothetical protein
MLGQASLVRQLRTGLFADQKMGETWRRANQAQMAALAVGID